MIVCSMRCRIDLSHGDDDDDTSSGDSKKRRRTIYVTRLVAIVAVFFVMSTLTLGMVMTAAARSRSRYIETLSNTSKIRFCAFRDECTQSRCNVESAPYLCLTNGDWYATHSCVNFPYVQLTSVFTFSSSKALTNTTCIDQCDLRLCPLPPPSKRTVRES